MVHGNLQHASGFSRRPATWSHLELQGLDSQDPALTSLESSCCTGAGRKARSRGASREPEKGELE